MTDERFFQKIATEARNMLEAIEDEKGERVPRIIVPYSSREFNRIKLHLDKINEQNEYIEMSILNEDTREFAISHKQN